GLPVPACQPAADPVRNPGDRRPARRGPRARTLEERFTDVPLAAAALPALRPVGQIAAIATPELDLDPLLDANITFHGVLIGDDGDRTRALAGLLDQGELRPVLSRRLPLEAAGEAHRLMANRTA